MDEVRAFAATGGRRQSALLLMVLSIALLAGCQTTLKHVPSAELIPLKSAVQAKVVVADIGDLRDEGPDTIGFGFSYWFPYKFYARDEHGSLPASYFVADSLSLDLKQIGFAATMANPGRKTLSMEKAIDAGKAADADFLVTTRLTDGKTNFWGFIIIPFFEPVWTRIGFDVTITDLKSGAQLSSFQTRRSGTEWRFAKVTVIDAVFDAAIFGRRWNSQPWSQTVVSDALAEATKRISDDIGKSKTANKEQPRQNLVVPVAAGSVPDTAGKEPPVPALPATGTEHQN